MTAPVVDLEYRRLPDRVQRFRQYLVHDAGTFIVTLLPSAPLARPLTVAGATLLEPLAPVVWFTYPDEWFDLGRFHLADGTFTGFYANVITPVERDGLRWRTTDLLLDVWIGADGRILLLDEEEFVAARKAGWMTDDIAAAARATADRLLADAGAGLWPAAHAHEWTLETVRRHLSP